MSQKTTSQMIARIFEIVGYALLLPTLFSLLYPGFFLIGALFTGHLAEFFISLLPFIVAGTGLVLLVNYFNHSRGRLEAEKLPRLWGVTFFFNVLPLLPLLYWFCSVFYSEGGDLSWSVSAALYIIWGAWLMWLATAVFLSGFAYYKDAVAQKYR